MYRTTVGILRSLLTGFVLNTIKTSCPGRFGNDKQDSKCSKQFDIQGFLTAGHLQGQSASLYSSFDQGMPSITWPLELLAEDILIQS